MSDFHFTVPEAPKRLIEGGGGPSDALATSAVSRVSEPAQADQLAQERIWRTLAAGLPTHHSWQRWLWLPAGTAVACAAAVAILRVREAPRAVRNARIELSSGGVLRANPSQDWQGTKAGDVLSESSRLHTEEGEATLALGDSEMLLEKGSDVGFEALGRNTFLRLEHGQAVFQVSHRKDGESFVVQTTRYRVTVRGTIFAVREKAADDVDVSVSRGLVEVTGEGGRWLVPAGSAWHSRTPEVPQVDDITAQERSEVGAADPRREAPAPTMAEAAAPAPAKQPTEMSAPTPAPTPGPIQMKSATAKRLKAPTHPTEPIAETKREASAAPAPVAPLLARLEPDERKPLPATLPPGASGTPSPAVSAPPPVLAQDPYEAALAVARGGDALAAAGALQKVLDTDGAHADLALYELGRLRQQRLADPLGALGAYQTYERKYPHGALLQEVRISAIEIQLQQENLTGAMNEIDSFLGAFGKSERAPEVHLLRGDVLRKRGNDLDARREYRRAAEQGMGEVAEEGLYREAVCAEHLGDTDAAAETLRTYLRKYPAGRHAGEASAALGGR